MGIRKRRGAVMGTAAVGLVLAGTGCNYPKIQKCHEQMKVSQEAMLQLSDSREDLALAESTLAAVRSTLAACKEAERAEEVGKVAQAEREVAAHVEALKERASREKRPKLTEAELAQLEKTGDPTCPKGQQYEHHQDGRLIDCKGPQLVDMNWSQASEYFSRRGFRETPDGSKLSFERGAQIFEFEYSTAKSSSAAGCVTVIADMGIPWQETVTRATGVQPQRVELGEPVKTARGSLGLLVEGGPEQYTVKLGKCAPTPGQKALEKAAEAP